MFSLPSFDERAFVILDLLNSTAAWGDDEVIELGSRALADELVGTVRSHPLRTSE